LENLPVEKPKVFLTRTIAEPAMQQLYLAVDLEVWKGENPPPHDVILARAAQVDGLITLLTDPIDQPVLEALAKKGKVISQMSVGFDNIDIASATRLGLPIGHTPGVLTETTADFAWALIMAGSRRVVEADQEVHRGIWRHWGPGILLGLELTGATLGIIGFGRIGQAVARRAAGFNMRVLYYNPHRREELEKSLGVTYVPMDDLLAQSDIVTIHSYLSKETHHLFGRANFEKMKADAILVNTARGQIVDPQDLLWALENKKIGAAALDVFEPEPIPAGHPLLSMPNVIVTPHIASATTQTRVRMATMAVENLQAGLKGERLPYCANPQVYTKS
jgi:glyoxylate reductase